MMRDEGYKSRYKDKPEKIQIVEDMKHEKGVRVPPPFPMKLEGWPNFWKHGEWNELRAKIFGNPPTITTLINGVKFMEWTDTKKRLGDKGSISLHVHGGGDLTKQFVSLHTRGFDREDYSCFAF